eukprot:CAMPEP_0172500916 /NCGR_PEP_ID=MMETSP1066-20121228/144088_1 /TAXON_ID=671091 /ORGANISM="Coscinodiscus wailesii, Strain CCMP2513" /LENGTH=173 /DNA_ID=CAMNT_0013275411 /DNA_START=114 /DNA_END=635 /DNA_ORIENTATION=-
MVLFLLVALTQVSTVLTFSTPSISSRFVHASKTRGRTSTFLNLSADADVKAKLVTGAELEIMLADMSQPIVIDAYATWCGPCLLMAPEFEEAAKELDGKVRFVKLDTDKEPEMAGRLNIMGLPTLLYLDKLEDENSGNTAALKERVEGALRKESIISLCDYHFFGGPLPTQLF